MDWLLLLLLLPVGLMLWQLAEALRFPLHRRNGSTNSFPGVTILKPLKGCDGQTRRCLQSCLELDYPGPLQVLFGVADPQDPVCALVNDLLRQCPQSEGWEARLVVCEKSLGANAKVSTLVQLEELARHEMVVISDADVWVPPDLLGELLPPLQSGAGLVNCFYRMAHSANCAMRLEAFATNADFWSQVLQARRTAPIDFALGAVMATTRSRLAKIGGFASLLDYLADDYQLGHRIAATGAPIALCPVVVDCWNDPASPGEVWAHQLRWARTIRVCRPGSYFLSILNNPTIWPLLLLACHPTRGAWAGLAGVVVLRMLAGMLMERKCNPAANWGGVFLGPMKDLLGLVLWAAAFFGNEVIWRGKRFGVLRGGRLVELVNQTSPKSS